MVSFYLFRVSDLTIYNVQNYKSKKKIADIVNKNKKNE